jgi:hypothetical protein
VKKSHKVEIEKEDYYNLRIDKEKKLYETKISEKKFATSSGKKIDNSAKNPIIGSEDDGPKKTQQDDQKNLHDLVNEKTREIEQQRGDAKEQNSN